MLKRLPFALVPLGVLLVALWTIPLPYYAEAPGPATDVEPLITLSGHERFDSGGRFILTTVTLQSVTAFKAFGAWLDPERDVVPRTAYIAPGETEQEANQRSISEMDQSKIDAAVVALEQLGRYPRQHGPGALVESVLSGCPAEGRLFPGDLVVRVDGQSVTGVHQFGRLLEALPRGHEAMVMVEAGGETMTVGITPRRCNGSGRRLLGVQTVQNFPFDLTISSGGIGGPSAGLMWALGLYDLLTAGDLTGGQIVAGTGQIDVDGNVYPIGGVELKVAAARRAGASVFLVPRSNLAAARTLAGEIRLVPVDDFHDALRFLEGV